MQNHNGFRRIICVTILCALLMVSMGKATRVSAVGTTIAGASVAALCAVGIVYCSYMALSGASIHVPDSVDNIQTWLQDMGNKVVQFPSGRAAYQELYPQLINVGDEPLTSALDRAWTWTSDKLKSWANDFSSVEVIENIASFVNYIDVSSTPINGVTYPFDFVTIPQIIGSVPFSAYAADGYTITPLSGYHVVITNYQNYAITNTNINVPARNLYSSGRYTGQIFVNGEWINLATYSIDVGFDFVNGNTRLRVFPVSGLTGYQIVGNSTSYRVDANNRTYPPITDAQIYDEATDTYLPLEETTSLVRNPQYPVSNNDDDFKPPVIPYVQLPFDPNWVDPITGSPGGGNWGFNLSRLLDALEDLAGTLIEIGAIGELINQFKDLLNGSSGDEYYIYYDDSEHNETYYNYYTITNYNGDIYNYDIDVSDADEHLPVDLNSISRYTHNNYLDEVKSAAKSFGSAIGEYVAFWHNCDPVITYTILGSFVLILIGAFIGKWGHS